MAITAHEAALRRLVEAVWELIRAEGRRWVKEEQNIDVLHYMVEQVERRMSTLDTTETWFRELIEKESVAFVKRFAKDGASLSSGKMSVSNYDPDKYRRRMSSMSARQLEKL